MARTVTLPSCPWAACPVPSRPAASPPSLCAPSDVRMSPVVAASVLNQTTWPVFRSTSDAKANCMPPTGITQKPNPQPSMLSACSATRPPEENES